MTIFKTRHWTDIYFGIGDGRSLRLRNAILIALLLSAILPAGTAFGQSVPPVYTFPECENVEEELLLGELSRIIRSVLDSEISGLDVEKIIEENWTDLELDSVVDRAVDDAVDRVREEEGTWDRIFSGWSEEKASEFAEKVAVYAFDSREFREGVGALSVDIVDDLTVEINMMTVKSASSALLCVQEFIGTTFSESMSLTLEENIRDWLAEIDSDLVDGAVKVDLGDHKISLAGIGTIVGTQIARKLGEKVAQGLLGKIVTRVLGRAASAVVPVAGWVIGGALIIYDLYKAWDGSLPQIQKDFRGESVKKTIRQEISLIVEEELREALPEISEPVTIEIFSQWKRFLHDFEHVLRLAQKNERFRSIVDGVTADQVEKLSNLVAIGDEVLGAEWLIRIIETGEFERILALPKDSFVILQEKADPEFVLAWADFAGEKIVRVVETALYEVASPSDFGDRDMLDKVLALEDPLVIQDFMQHSEEEREALLSLSTAQNRWIFTELSKAEAQWLAAYLSEMPSTAQSGLVEFVIRDRALISQLQGNEALRAKFPTVLTLAETSPNFKSILNGRGAEQVESLSALVEVASEALEQEQLRAMINGGQFEEILAFPRATFEILREEKDPALVISWYSLAGDEVGRVVETGLFRVASPSDFSGEKNLEKVISLQSHEAVRKLMLLAQKERDILIELPTVQARAILVTLTVEELAWLADYLLELTARGAGLMVEQLLQEPELLPMLEVSVNLRAKFPEVLALADRNQQFRAILNNTDVVQSEKLSNLVAIAVESLTQEKLAKAIETGQFDRIFALPEDTFEILRDRKDPTVVISWATLAGQMVGRVVETELYRVASPSDFSGRDALSKVLTLEDPAAIRKLMELHQIERVVLLGLATTRARSALIALSMEDLSWLALYLAELPADEKDPVVEYILHEQGLIPLMKDRENVRTKFPRVLMLALASPRLDDFLNSLSLDDLEKLSELVAAADATMALERLDEMVDSGQLERIFVLPQTSFEILRVTGNPALVLEWANLAGEAIDEVIETALYLVAPPLAFQGQEDLKQVLAIEDPIAIQRLMKLGQLEREAILNLSHQDARETLLSDLSEDELSWLASYLPVLSAPAQQLLAFYSVREKELIPNLRSSEDLRNRFPLVLNLALTVSPFKEILDDASVKSLGKLAELVEVADEALTPEQLTEMVESGHFDIILALHRHSFEILKYSGSPTLVLAWANLAGEAIIQVVETRLYEFASPEQFRNREDFITALSLQDTEALKWILQLSQDDRSYLLSSLEVEEILWLVSYKSDLSDGTSLLLANHIDRNPALMHELEIDRIGQTFKKSQNPEAVLTFVSARAGEPQTLLPTVPFLLATSDFISADLSWVLYRHYHLVQSLLLLSALVLSIVLILAGWWLYRRRLPGENGTGIRNPK